MSEISTPVQSFPYRSRGSLFWSGAAPLLGLILMEGGGLAALAWAFVPEGPLRLAALAAVLAIFAGVPLFLFMAPLTTRHRLTPTHLELRYGRHHFSIPRDAIRSAAATQVKVEAMQTLGARYVKRQDAVVACFSDQGQVVLELDPPAPFQLSRSGRPRICGRVVFNVDRRDELLAALEPRPRVEAADAEPEVFVPAPVPTLRPRVPAVRSGGPLAIETRALVQRYGGGFTAVENLELRVPVGEIYGFLGLNGAGKTTTIKMLVGLLQPTSGHAVVAGHDVWSAPLAAKAAFGYVPDRAILYDRLTGREFLEFLGQMRGIPRREAGARIAHLLELLDLAAHAGRACGTYSFGMKRKLSLAAALLHQPSVLILDEPFNGLDPRSAHRLKTLFTEMCGDTTFLLSTHDLATAEAVCHRVGILHGGRLIAEGTPDEVRSLASGAGLEEAFLELTGEVVPAGGVA